MPDAPSPGPHPVAPPRLALSPGRFVVLVVLLALAILALERGWTCGTELADGAPHMARVLGEMWPPSVARWDAVVKLLLETAFMAVAGAAVGCGLAFLVALVAARNLAPHPLARFAARGLVSFFRTVPDLVWAVFFVASVGLGPVAGTLTIVVDTIGFCGRFYADAMEEADPGPQEALVAGGAGRLGVILAAVVPSALPSMVNASTFALEKAVRASVVLGLVGAGGIGIELKAAMDMFQYAEATTIILAIFLLVLGVEQLSALVRKRIL
jgi:phosphonate transport system permease protein